ncbi:DUF262 domain-containing protein [Chlorogloeopsis fritschii PCC 9212]|uniref:DUF262 domain-containing protein n=1 Tax=Chlorogloeopsis fritschii PCC 6912 TaxID=211165 RepID=A0A433NPK1_CHLFR|nr:DUF262 domain-containing protein [Chlorogloeopsis fritschii]RUR85752.1 hypothetical protein PCC6912_05770 [Chlorogloeopsis fritschii PCC 6912]
MSQKTIDSKNLTIEKIFEDFYIIPNYQREYIWKEKQVLELLNDVYSEFPASSNIESDEYFLGSIVICPSSDDTDNVYQVIDGQQRLTTSYIFFCAIKNYITKLPEHQKFDAIKKLIFSEYTNAQGQDQSRYRINPQYPDSKNILEEFAKDEINIEGIENQKNNKTESTINLISAYQTIEDFIKDKFKDNEIQIKRFYAHFIKKVKLVRVETTDINHALRVFETINNRGVGLDSMDLLKNLLFKQVEKEDFSKISNSWKEIKNELDSVKEKPMDFLRYFILTQYDVERDNVQTKEYQWLLENKTTCKYEEKPFEFVEELLKAAKAYKLLVERKNPADNSDNPHLANIKYLSPNLKQHLYMLLAARDLPMETFTQLCLHIENFIFIYSFPNNSISELEKIFINWGQEIRKIVKSKDKEEQLSNLKVFIDNNLGARKENLKKSFEKKFNEASQLDFNSRGTNKKPTSNANKKTKYILAKIYQYVQLIAYRDNDEYKNFTTFTQSSIEIEHILPQDLNSEPVRTFDKPDEIESYIYKLGNLALIEQPLNASIQNSSFKVKKGAYQQSNLLLTQCISKKPTIGSNTAINRAVEDLISFHEWNSQAIDKRQEMLTALALKIWYEEVSFGKNDG